MKISKYSHRKAESTVPRHILYPIYWDLEKLEYNSIKKGTRVLRKAILQILEKHGWSDKVKLVPESNITITSMFDSTGLCIQFGNMARFYADLMKMELMHKNKKIDSAIYILAKNDFAKTMGSNVVNFERVTNELEIFYKIINVPIMVIGIQG